MGFFFFFGDVLFFRFCFSAEKLDLKPNDMCSSFLYALGTHFLFSLYISTFLCDVLATLNSVLWNINKCL